MNLIVKLEDSGKRLDCFVKEKIEELSRSYIQKLINNEHIVVIRHTSTGSVYHSVTECIAGSPTMDSTHSTSSGTTGSPTKASYKLKTNDLITLNIPAPVPLEIKAEKIPLQILYEDDDLIAVNKPAGMTTHPGAGQREGTLVNALLAHCKNLSGIGGVERPGIVHRLDKDTSGVIIVAKNDFAHHNLSLQIQKRTIKKYYIALVMGEMPAIKGEIIAPIGRHPVNRKKMAVVPIGKNAVSEWKVIEQRDNITLLEVQIKTGRTHQIRVHLSYINHPLIGDPVYGKKTDTPILFYRQALHAYKLNFIHPRNQKQLELIASIPDDIKELLKNLNFTNVLINDE